MTMTQLDFELHDYMRKALEHSGLGVQEIADRLGVSRTSVGRWINGHGTPTTATLMAWAMVTGVDYEWLCARRDSNPQPSDWEFRDLYCEICGSRFHLAQECQQGERSCFICGGEHDLDDCPRADGLDDLIDLELQLVTL